MLCVIYWLDEGCLSQFRQQGFSTLPARICNLHDKKHGACRISIGLCAGSPTAPLLLLLLLLHHHQTRNVKGGEEALISLPCAERHVCVNSYGDSGGEWSSCHQIPADAPTVIQRRLSYREKTFIRRSQSERFIFIASEKDQWSGVAFHVYHNNGVWEPCNVRSRGMSVVTTLHETLVTESGFLSLWQHGDRYLTHPQQQAPSM
ncbi:unnamed protein product [Scomber scombrus]|uniref:Unnamed protein product n=1 Tax=Scomber scombrus TaxID=13677 RepID=A0AAV1PF15_SCOSC